MKEARNRRILYVEDDLSLCELFETVLTPLGYTVDCVQTGGEGIERHTERPYDIVALDYQLPDMTGLDIAGIILGENQDLPVIMITGQGNEKVAAEALKLGVSNYIVKGAAAAYLELLPSVVAHLERRAELAAIMRSTTETLLQAEAESKQNFFTQLDAAERYEAQARELADLAAELTAANYNLVNNATKDELTELANFRLCKDRLRVAIATARRSDREVAFLHIDLDGFKTVNSIVGRAGGDAILREVAGRLHPCIRDMDTVARLRGDRFGLVVSNFEDRSTVGIVAERVKESLSLPFKVGETEVPLSFRLGVAVYPEHGSSFDELLDHAETAVYKAELFHTPTAAAKRAGNDAA